MSAIAGIMRLDGGPAARGDLERMANSLKSHGPDRQSVVTAGAVGFAHLLMRMTPEDTFDRQPLRGASGALFVADLRLDNREDIAAALGLDRERALSASDAALALAAWERWGDAVWAKLHGPFAIAVWDARTRALTLARDHLGTAPLTWHRGPRFFAFATLPKGLLALPDVPRVLNEEKFADFLVLNSAEHETTLYRDLFRIPPAHVAHVDAEGNMTARPYWSADDIKPVRLKSDQDYADALREQLDRAVRRQLRSIHAVGCFLSGGLDSPSVAAFASRALAERGKRLAAYTQVPRAGFRLPPDARGCADESPQVEAISRALGNIDVSFVRSSDCDSFEALEHYFHATGEPVRNPPNLGWMVEIIRLARSRGERVLLCGDFGNLTISWDGWYQALAHLAQGRWLAAFRLWRLLYRLSSRSRLSAARVLFLEPLGLDWRSLVSRVRIDGAENWRAYSPIRPDYAAGMGVEERAQRVGHDFLHRLPTNTVRYRLGILNRFDDRGNWHAGMLALHGVDLRDPTSDLDVVSFCLGIPDEQYLVEDIDRSLIRRAMWGILPQSTLTNRVNGVQAADWFETLTARQGRMIREIAELRASPLASRTIDLDRLERAVRNWPSGNWHKRRVLLEYEAALVRGLACGRYVRWFEQAN